MTDVLTNINALPERIECRRCAVRVGRAGEDKWVDSKDTGTGRRFYMNTRTKQTSWDAPPVAGATKDHADSISDAKAQVLFCMTFCHVVSHVFLGALRRNFLLCNYYVG